jgi:hypothetical protein
MIDPPPIRVELELGSTRQAYNSARLPGKTGTLFSLRDLIGAEKNKLTRLSLFVPTNQNHGFRVLAAPLTLSGDGNLTTPVDFEGTNFSGPTRGVYQFNSYRVSYYSVVRSTPKETIRIGGTMKIRDAKILLQQGALSKQSYNLGIVPLFYASGERTLAPRWELRWDFDGLAAPQGRAFDLGARIAYRTAPQTWLTMGVRTLEGGADNKIVYNFTRLDSLTVGISRSW